MNQYQTGDLYLENTWSLNSLLEHSHDPKTRWSNVGLFEVEETELNGEKSIEVSVCMFIEGALQVVPLDTLLRRPILHAAAHRSLSSNVSKESKYLIADIMYGRLNEKTVYEVSAPMKRIISAGSSEGGVKTTTMGVKVDSKGRDIRHDGFVKGHPNSGFKNSLTSVELIASTLIHSKLISSNSELSLSSFQEGGDIDRVYGRETPLFPRASKSNIPSEETILMMAQAEAVRLVRSYYEATPVMNHHRYLSSTLRRSVSNGMDDVVSEDDDRYMVEEGYAAYPEQQSNTDRYGRRDKTASNAEINRSDSQDRRIRQRQRDAQSYDRPKPGYK